MTVTTVSGTHPECIMTTWCAACDVPDAPAHDHETNAVTECVWHDQRSPGECIIPQYGRKKLRPTWLLVVVALFVGVSLGIGVTALLVESLDPWNGVPPCTDAIADAGGVCHGEPS